MGSEGDSVPARTRGERFRVIAPWLVCLGIFGGGAVVFDGLERAIAVGAFSASWVGALLAVSQVRGAVVSMRRWMGNRESALSTFADDRAAAVARQFQWAVEELVRARAELRKVDGMRAQAEERARMVDEKALQDGQELRVARERLGAVGASELDLLRAKIERIEQSFQEEERDRRTAEARARAAEQRVADLTRTLRLVATTVSSGGESLVSRAAPIQTLALDWTLEYEGSGHSLRLRPTSDVIPSKARIVDATGRLVAESVVTLQHHPAGLLLRVPQSVAAAVEAGDWSAFQLEAEVDGVWQAAELVDRAQPLVDAEVMQPRSLRIVS